MNAAGQYRGGAGRCTAGSALAVVALLLVVAGRVGAWSPLDQTETWSLPGTAGWSNDVAGASVTNPAGALNVAFAAQSAPNLVGAIARRTLDPGTLLTNLSFHLAASAIPPSQLNLCLHSRLTGNLWYYALPVPAAGTGLDYQVPVDYAAGWRMGPLSTPEAFQTDMKTLDWVGLYVRRSSDTAAQASSLDDFHLQGQSWPEDWDLDGMDNNWELRYGLQPNDPRDATADADQDGMSNLAEARAGTDPTNAASRFLVHLDMGGSSGGPALHPRIWWNSISNRSYTLWRTTRLGEAFAPVQTGVLSTPDTNSFEDVASTNADSVFYRVEVEP